MKHAPQYALALFTFSSLAFSCAIARADTPYGSAYDKVSQLLGESGIRHIRDGLHARELDLFNRFGIKTTLIMSPPRDPRESLKELEPVAHTLAMIEGPNEVDILPQSGTYKGQPFPQGARLFQDELYAAVKENPLLKHLPVIAPSTARGDSNSKLAPLKSFDLTVMHSYAGGAMPSRSLSNETIDNLKNASRIQGRNEEQKPIAVTESGYHTALRANLTLGGVQPGISEEAHRKYLPRHFAEYFNAGIARTISYEFINEFADEATNAEASFGMVRRDLTPKPAYSALKTLIGYLSEKKWDAQKKEWLSPVVAAPNVSQALDFDARIEGSNVHHTLLRKADGTFFLLLWREVSSFDTQKGADIKNDPSRVRLTFNTPVRAATLRGLGDTKLLDSWAAPREIDIAVPDEVVVLEITSPPVRANGMVTLAPAGLASTSTNDSVALTWRPGGREVAGYFVWHGDRYLGATTKPLFAINKLVPATGYRLRVQSFDRDGRVSPFAETVAFTNDAFPDLVIFEAVTDPQDPNVGDEVGFKATIENRGTAPTTEGTTLGVAFYVDNHLMAWSDTFNKSLAPGEKIEVTANSGPKGTATFKAVAGGYTLRAVVDDVNRINESDEANNEKTTEFDVQ
jgi:hypothetical protein